MPTGQEPAEGDRKTIERELARQKDVRRDGVADQPKPDEPDGSHSNVQNPNPKLEHPQRGN
jgi:hypothetical protein